MELSSQTWKFQNVPDKEYVPDAKYSTSPTQGKTSAKIINQCESDGKVSSKSQSIIADDETFRNKNPRF